MFQEIPDILPLLIRLRSSCAHLPMVVTQSGLGETSKKTLDIANGAVNIYAFHKTASMTGFFDGFGVTIDITKAYRE